MPPSVADERRAAGAEPLIFVCADDDEIGRMMVQATLDRMGAHMLSNPNPNPSPKPNLCRGGEAPLELLALALEVERRLQPAAPLGEGGVDLVERALHLGEREARVRIGRDAAPGTG